MKLLLDDQNRVVGYTKDPLFKDFQAECDVLPEVNGGDALSDYKYIEGGFVYDPQPKDEVKEESK